MPSAAKDTTPEAKPSTADSSTQTLTNIALIDGVDKKQIQAKVTVPDPYESPFDGNLELNRWQFAPEGPFKFSAEVGDCVNGFLLTERIEVLWMPGDGPTKSIKVKVFGYRWNQILMARNGRTLRGDVWKSEPIFQLILRNKELLNAGDAVRQLALMKLNPEGDFRSYRDQFANTPYEVSQTQWEFADQVLNRIRPAATRR